MTCREVEILLGAYVDDELSSPDADAVNSHLAACAPCGEVRQTLVGVQQLLRASAPALAEIPGRRAAAPRRARYALAAGVAATILLGVAGSQRWAETALRALPPPADERAVSVTRDPLAAIDCRIGASDSACEIETSASFCSSARDCGLPF